LYELFLDQTRRRHDSSFLHYQGYW